MIGYIHGHVHEKAHPSIAYLGSIGEAERIISSIPIDILILADLEYDRQRILHSANACEREMIEFKVVPSYFQILVSGLHLETANGVPVLGVSRLPLDRIANRTFKRLVDMGRGYRRSNLITAADLSFRCNRLFRVSGSDLLPPTPVRKKRQTI